MNVKIRVALPNDLESILALFKDCVLSICQDHYSAEQLTAWASSSENVSDWTRKVESQFFIVAINNEMIVGFGSLEGDDTLDLLYVHKNFQRAGVAGKLFHELQIRAEQLGTKVLKADVSKTARRFFEDRGFKVVVHQSTQTRGVALENYRMIKAL